MQTSKKFKEIIKGNGLIYFSSMIHMLFSNLFYVLMPAIIWFAMDYIVGNKPIDNPFIKYFIDILGGRNHLKNNILIVGILFLLVSALSSFFTFLKTYYANKATENMVENIRNRLYKHLNLLPVDFFNKRKSGDILQRSTSDIETIRNLFSVQLVEVLGSISVIVFVLIVMYKIDVSMAVVCTIVCSLIAISSIWFYKKVKFLYKSTDEAEAKLTSTIQENLQGIKVIKAFNLEGFEKERFIEKNTVFKDNQNKLMIIYSRFWAINDFLTLGQVAFVIIYGGIRTITGSLTIGDLTAFVLYLFQIIWPVRQLGKLLTDTGKAVVSLDRLYEILDSEVEDLNEGIHVDIDGDIEFKNIYFKYPNTNEYSLEDISFSLKSGETLGIIGPTGSGKSTLTFLLQKLYSPTKGDILLNDINIKEISKKSIRDQIGIVLQESFLYNKTIFENFKMVKPDVTKKEIEEVCKIANVYDDIKKFPKGLDTVVGESGSSLSGGQRQRVSIARTLLLNPNILIFDDSLSAVDARTDANIRASLEKLGSKTKIIIAHRVSTIMNSDKIIVLDEGRLVQFGNHNTLISQDGYYKTLYEVQNQVNLEKVGALNE